MRRRREAAERPLAAGDASSADPPSHASAPERKRGRAAGARGLDRNVLVARSPIHGRGVFAARAFRKGARIGEFEGAPAKRDGRHVLWVVGDDGSMEGRRGTNALRFLNHADEPNAEFDGFVLRARKAIRAGEEITIHYGAADG